MRDYSQQIRTQHPRENISRSAQVELNCHPDFNVSIEMNSFPKNCDTVSRCTDWFIVYTGVSEYKRHVCTIIHQNTIVQKKIVTARSKNKCQHKKKHRERLFVSSNRTKLCDAGLHSTRHPIRPHAHMHHFCRGLKSAVSWI